MSLTDADVETLQEIQEGVDALRVIAEQAARIAELERELTEARAYAVSCEMFRAEQKQLAAANALLDALELELCGTPNFSAALSLLAMRPHLSAQPSAPVKTPELRPGCTTAEYYEPAARTDHDRAVLEAMGRASTGGLRGYAAAGDWLGDACRAELARREAEK